ncbi:dienelactone hydrolase family protein [Fulvivirgaceae bacterium BMA10]|uniref:Dienelactone hydrolase family protein n=1 Tax=Splendidivirga corallicola TaxID=3051826 RepID=A0ABT8KSR1_9BACT|nr:dienelactone hydrolase family protein [Fulvivirgaceae bacterium BMA10]
MKKLTLILSALFMSSLTMAQQEWAKKQLEESPRHHEWVKVKYGDRVVESFLVYPEVSNKATVVIVIHENRGLNDWARSIADQIAGEGYIAIAPDLLTGSGPNGGKTSDFASSDDARNAIYQLSQDQVTADLKAIQNYASTLPAANGKVAVIGFCWGGSQSFRYATNQSDLQAAIVCYGRAPQEEQVFESITAPVYGFYGGNDARVNATIESTTANMKAAGKHYEPVIYDGAGHGFIRSGEMPNAGAANKKGREEAWKRLKKILAAL